ncbi:adenylate/guanylate cyclase domain-containing protein [Nocardiopsis dassonvillei]|uniref:Adenylate/guanylate cyclase n=1 Tax=Nocardiopsis dassonvillei (strain ATCC 23218 / DSM 43111 / CIP 107115 / JCM 7437 / KCTC 9190 / NBRC 14626 / NCTC 10488 / NRRL B-5397 / IMRU 509) TaxID=446468 RepID=D7AX54_NOCDD|nr:adenylate/guanylate cyclase domain-containing protein [Nocardiopsis dassonvillei]ADH69824.1 putative adenylate/guanylate cyclase [Nocardiopsis dassonvillei subsp. dassonvillei DSM 43111]NKY78867.1 adenylate/guanylate cyclase domain-containing protein [Nocardiopsis dassonvillei]VEI90336.1 Uncharacterised protein [Nocardiopsis dassonvillei]
MTEVDVDELLDALDDNVKNQIASMPAVVDKGDSLDVEKLPIEARQWYKLTDVVAVVADLKNSTKLGTGKRAASTASIYDASTGSVVKVFNKFDADFLAIQGDGAFALYWGDKRYERAMCSAITIKTFSDSMVSRLKDKWNSLPETGFKVGVASSRLLVKRIGTPRNHAQQEPVWAGKAVNYAAKAAQGANCGEIVVTGSVWDSVEKNDFLAISCPCHGGPGLNIWSDIEIDRLPDGDPEAKGRMLTAGWCVTHGEEYCTAILEGRKKREDAKDLREALQKSKMRNAVRLKAQRDRQFLRDRRRGLTS